MNKKYVIVFIAAIILLVAALTNPGLTQHKDAVKGKIISYIKKRAGAGGGFGALLAEAMVQQTVNGIVTNDNYLFFSLTKINWEGDSRIVGLGLFGNVFTFGKINDLAGA